MKPRDELERVAWLRLTNPGAVGKFTMGRPVFGCVPHMVDAGEFVAAVGEHDGVSLCAGCKAAAERGKRPRANWERT